MDLTSHDNAALATRAIGLLGKRKFDALRAMMADNMQAEGPYHPGGPATFEGADRAMRDFKQIRIFESFSIDIVNVFDTGNDTVIVEARSHGVRREMPAYDNHYLFVLTFKNGLLMKWREFYNPLEAMKQGYGKAV